MQTHVDSLQGWAYWLEETALERDLVIFDQRGLKPGEPYWDCETYNDLNRKILPQNLTVQQEYDLTADVLAECLERFDQWLRGPAAEVQDGVRSFSTVAAAADLNRMLELLGYKAWHLWGVSYGSRLALVAAQQKPRPARSLLLDSPYPLDQGGASDKPALYAQALERFWTLCSNNAAFCGRDIEDPEALFWRVLQQLNTEPVRYEVTVPGSSVDTTMVLNGQRLFSLALFALYDQRFYSELLEALVVLSDPATESSDELELGPVQLLLNSFVASALDKDFNTMIFYAIECNDNPLQPEEIHKQTLAAHPRLRELLHLDAAHNPCRSQVFDPADLLHSEPAPNVPTLILAGELDPVTPVAWGESLAESLPRAELVVAPRVGHAVLSSGVCAPSFYNDYLSAPNQGRAAVRRHCF